MGDKNDNLIIDCFAGGGGASVGIEMALGRQVDIAINHDPQAIIMHKTNHPRTKHITEDIFSVDLQKYVKGRKVALMWASPDCFPAGNLVWTDKGYMNIEDVRPLDKVLTHTGRMQTVTRFIKKNDRNFMNIKISGCEEFQATLNHPFYARKKYIHYVHGEHRTGVTMMKEPEWVKAEDLTADYRVGIPINRESKIPEWHGYVKTTANAYGITTATIINELEPLMSDPWFWYFVGMYFGDGSISKDIVDLCCEHKSDEIKHIRYTLDNIGIKYTERDKKETHSFCISNKELCEFLRQFGVGSQYKSITPTILNLPKLLLARFLEGYLYTDGSYQKTETNGVYSITTVSKHLAYGLQQCLLKVWGRYGSMTIPKKLNCVINGRVVNSRKAYRIDFYAERTARQKYVIEDGIAWVNVKSVKRAPQEQKSIYTLSVDTDESFTVNNIAVHNCTQFSKAKGSKPRVSGIRMLPWAVYKHAKAVHPEVLIMENVEEIQDWGALDENGYPIEEDKGKEYERFILAMKSLGYDFDSKELIAADYGAPTTRKRWYAIFRRDGRRIVWPTPTHFKELEPKWKECGDYIDWSDLGSSIFDRKKPLAEKTQARIAYGIKKYILDNPNPYVVKDNRALAFMIQYHSEQKSGDSRGQLLTEPIKTLDTSNRYGLVSAFITKFYKTGIGQGCNEPLHTITTSPGHFGLVSAFLVKYYSGSENNQAIDRPIDTLVTKDRFGLVSAFLIQYYGRDDAAISLENPLYTVTTKDRFGLVGVLVDIKGEKYIMSDIFLRMLKPEELKVLQGFPKDYIIDRDYLWRPYPKKEQVARIGNSVVPVMAKVLVEANCPYLKVGERQPIPQTYWQNNGQMAFA